MIKRPQKKKLVIINQAANYLTVGLCNAFHKEFDSVALITGSIHEQGESLNTDIRVEKINRWAERPAWKKLASYIVATTKIYLLIIRRYKAYDVLFLSLPPMAYLLNLLVKNRFSMIIWDVYPDIFKITGMNERSFIYKTWAKLNKKSFAKAYKLYTISHRMKDLLKKYATPEKIIVQPIWAIFENEKKIDKFNNPFIEKYNPTNNFIVQYSGNIGITHKIELLLDLAARMESHSHIQFQIIGRGPRIPYLEKTVNSRQLSNVIFLPFQKDSIFIYSLSAADVGVVILDEKVSKGSVPSKSYNLMALGIPSLYFAARDSELMTYVNYYSHGKCFTENEVDRAVEFILKLSKDTDYYTELSKNAISASAYYKRGNADKFVKEYFLSDS